MYARVAAGLARIDDSGVRLCAQTLPPYPWYMGGQLYCNLFVDPRDTAEFAERYDRRLCFDVSHSKLSANYLGMSFADATALLAPHTEHLHLVDATGVDGEGVQVGDGEIDWPCSPSSSTSCRPESASSRRSGRDTSMTARASGSPWSGWSNGSDAHPSRCGWSPSATWPGSLAMPSTWRATASPAGGWSS